MKIEKPNKVSRSFTQHLGAPPESVFELLCPVREIEWVNDWRPKLILTESGVMEPGCVFVTPGIPEDALWLVTDHDPENFHLEIIKIIPGVVIGSIVIDLAPDKKKSCTAKITYGYTSLSDHGDRALKEFTEAHFQSFMEFWEVELNHFLTTGEKLDVGEGVHDI